MAIKRNDRAESLKRIIVRITFNTWLDTGNESFFVRSEATDAWNGTAGKKRNFTAMTVDTTDSNKRKVRKGDSFGTRSKIHGSKKKTPDLIDHLFTTPIGMVMIQVPIA